MPAKHAAASRPAATIVDAAWCDYDAALATWDRTSNVQSWPARQILESAIRRLRAIDPHFNRRPRAA
jgi:hypothetical protein